MLETVDFLQTSVCSLLSPTEKMTSAPGRNGSYPSAWRQTLSASASASAIAQSSDKVFGDKSTPLHYTDEKLRPRTEVSGVARNHNQSA